MINIFTTTKILTSSTISFILSFIKLYLWFMTLPYLINFIGLFCTRRQQRILFRISNPLKRFNKNTLKGFRRVIVSFFKYIYLLIKFKSFTDLFKIEDLKKLIMNLNPEEFEEFCADVYRKLGYKAKVTQFGHDGGKDIILTDKENNLLYVECKRWHEEYGKEIGREICQKLIGSCASDGVNSAILVTTGKIHQNAIEYQKNLNNVKSFNLQIVDFEELIYLYLKAYKVNKKNKLEKAI